METLTESCIVLKKSLLRINDLKSCFEKNSKKVPKRFGHVGNSPYLCTRFQKAKAL